MYARQVPHRLFKWTESEIHIKNVERLFVWLCQSFGIAQIEILLHLSARLPVIVLLWCQVKRRCNVVFTKSCAYDIAAKLRVIFGYRRDI